MTWLELNSCKITKKTPLQTTGLYFSLNIMLRVSFSPGRDFACRHCWISLAVFKIKPFRQYLQNILEKNPSDNTWNAFKKLSFRFNVKLKSSGFLHCCPMSWSHSLVAQELKQWNSLKKTLNLALQIFIGLPQFECFRHVLTQTLELCDLGSHCINVD